MLNNISKLNSTSNDYLIFRKKLNEQKLIKGLNLN